MPRRKQTQIAWKSSRSTHVDVCSTSSMPTAMMTLRYGYRAFNIRKSDKVRLLVRPV
jgi:hypothetical protein